MPEAFEHLSQLSRHAVIVTTWHLPLFEDSTSSCPLIRRFPNFLLGKPSFVLLNLPQIYCPLERLCKF
jgi:hypothetical protein